MKMISTHDFAKSGLAKNRRRFMKVKDYLDFDGFGDEMGVSQMGIISNQTEFDAVYQLCSASSVNPKTFHCSPSTISKIATYL